MTNRGHHLHQNATNLIYVNILRNTQIASFSLKNYFTIALLV